MAWRQRNAESGEPAAAGACEIRCAPVARVQTNTLEAIYPGVDAVATRTNTVRPSAPEVTAE